jgi:integrase
MRSKRPDGSIRERSEGCFQIRYTLDLNPLTGKRKRIEVTHKGTYESAKVHLRRLLKSIDDHQHVDPTKTRVSEFLTQWLETVRSQISAKTHERYTDFTNHFLIPALGAHQIIKLELSAIQQAYNKWETSGRRNYKGGGLSPRTRLHIHRVLKLALKHAVRMRLIARNPADDVMAPRVKKSTIATLTIEQSTVLLDALRDTPLYWPVLLALTTGMRRGEIVALRWRNVDFQKKTIRVVESVEQVRTAIRFKAPKTERTRAIILPDYAFQEFKEWKDKQAKRLAELGVTATEETFVFGRSWDGGVVKPDSLTAEFRVAIRKVPNFPIVRFHDLRHFHATQLLMEGVHPKIAQERLGHSTITTTMDLYSHVTDTMQNDAAEKLDTAFRSAIRSRPKNDPQLG